MAVRERPGKVGGVVAVLDVVRTRSRLRREALTVGLASLALTVATNVDQLRYLTTTAAGDLGDPLYFAWQLAWVAHAMRTDPSGIWTTNAFSQAPDNLAFTDTVLGYAPLGVLMPGGQSGALAQLNLALLLATALAVVGAYALARAMGAGKVGALVAGAGFGFAPWRLQQVIHINVVSTGGIALALAFLARGNGWSLRHGWCPERMDRRWICAGWAAACYQLTFGFATGIWFAYSLALPMLAWAVGWLVLGRRRVRRLPIDVLVPHGVGGAAFLFTAVLLVQPYLRVIAAHPEVQRGRIWLPLFSPPWRGLVTAPDSDIFWAGRQVGWRSAMSWPPEMVLSPGVVLVTLAGAGLFWSVWPWRRRLGLAVATAMVTLLALGTNAPGGGRVTYLPLFDHAPGWEALRTPGRLIIWVTLGLCMLAAGAVARCYQEIRGRLGRPTWTTTAGALALALPVLGALPAAAVVYEGRNQVPHWPVAVSPVRLTALRAPLLLLPTDNVGDYHMMLWSTEGWPVLANGSSGFDSVQQVALRTAALGFPDAASVAALKARGVLTVVVIRSRAIGSQWAGAADTPVTSLALRRTDLGDAVVFDLDRSPR
jgi:hypothetical protein